jgi:hypothetical protein
MSETSQSSNRNRDVEDLDIEDLFATEQTDVSLDQDRSTADEPSNAEASSVTGSRTETPTESESGPSGSTATGPEDTTASAVFQQLREEAGADADTGSADPDAVASESPDEIIAKADESTTHVDAVDESIRADDDALDDLLLTERREADGFLWVATDGDESTDAGLAWGDDPDTESDANAESDESSDEQLEDASVSAANTAGEGGLDETKADDGAIWDSGTTFEERAATFENVESEPGESGVEDSDGTDTAEAEPSDATDASRVFDTETSTGSPVSAGGGDSTDGDPTGDSSDDGDPTGDSSDDGDPTGDSSDDGDDEDGGLASRIRTILSG